MRYSDSTVDRVRYLSRVPTPPAPPSPRCPETSPMTRLHRRNLLRFGVGAFGSSLTDYLGVRHQVRASGGETAPRATSCIVLYCWGGMSHHETWDPKPDAPREYRGEFRPIATVVPGVRLGGHLPRLARHTDKLAIIRSMHHRSSDHGKGMYCGTSPDIRRRHRKSRPINRLHGRTGRTSGP